MTLAHEMGHWLDVSAIGTKYRWASEGHQAMRAAMDAIRGSKAAKQIQQVKESGVLTKADGTTVKLVDRFAAHVDYLLSDRELWARAYAQYIATRSGDTLMKKELESMLKLADHKLLHKQWFADDFKPIAEAIDELFRTKGWME